MRNVTDTPVASASRTIQSISASCASGESAGRLAAGPGGRELEHAVADLRERAGDGEQLVLGREGAGHGLTVDGPVAIVRLVEEAQRAGAQRVLDDARHPAMSSAVEASLRAPRSPMT